MKLGTFSRFARASPSRLSRLGSRTCRTSTKIGTVAEPVLVPSMRNLRRFGAAWPRLLSLASSITSRAFRPGRSTNRKGTPVAADHRAGVSAANCPLFMFRKILPDRPAAGIGIASHSVLRARMIAPCPWAAMILGARVQISAAAFSDAPRSGKTLCRIDFDRRIPRTWLTSDRQSFRNDSAARPRPPLTELARSSSKSFRSRRNAAEPVLLILSTLVARGPEDSNWIPIFTTGGPRPATTSGDHPAPAHPER